MLQEDIFDMGLFKKVKVCIIDLLQIFKHLLTHFRSIFPFYIPQNTFSGGIESV